MNSPESGSRSWSRMRVSGIVRAVGDIGLTDVG
jgi:hypothetical protein